MYGLANGDNISVDIGFALIELMSEMVASTVVFGVENSEPLHSVTALESAGIEIDPRSESLSKLTSVKLK